MIVSWEKILTNLTYKAPEIRVSYLLAELKDYVDEHARQEQRIEGLEAKVQKLETEISFCPLCSTKGSPGETVSGAV